ELVEKIIEYEKIRAMVRSFDAFPVLGRDTFARNTAILEDEEADILSLCTLFFQLVKEKEERFIAIQEIRPTLEEKLAQIKALLAQAGVFTWKMSLEQEMRDKVATALAIL